MWGKKNVRRIRMEEMIMYKFRKLLALCLAAAFAAGILSGYSAQAKAKTAVSCKSLCSTALKATGGSKKLKYTSASAIDFGGLSASDRNKVKEIRYICDSKEVYSLCVIRTKDTKDSAKVLSALKKYKKNNCTSDYLSDYSAAEKKVFKNAVCGRKGTYVWYIAMSPKKAKNNKGQKSIKKRL